MAMRCLILNVVSVELHMKLTHEQKSTIRI